ncbi:type II secretion system F family protein [Streptomyces armeniacus]|uniref:type II secretion system F family protein n=1 Tax=Streptomyces armeniacus TaxID=83291 RepID=UPI001AD804F4|nr:pilus assembly protein TadB [Streptomyces armeniacus]
MNGYVALLGLCGLGLGMGLILLVRAWRGTLPAARPAPWQGCTAVRRPRPRRWRLLAAAAGIVTGVVTGWVAGALLVALAAWNLPHVWNTTAVDQEKAAQVEGIAGWAEMLRDTLSAAAGLEQTIMATAHTAPQAVRSHMQGLAAHLAAGERLSTGLRRLQADLRDPSADLVIAALLLASQHQARQLAPLLGELAATARAQVQMRQRIEASRARMRTTVRTVMATTLTFAGGLTVLNAEFLRPYDTAAGQLMLLVVGAIFAGAFVWLRRIARIEEPQRFLADLDTVGHGLAEASVGGEVKR